jgi:hypothetical protein
MRLITVSAYDHLAVGVRKHASADGGIFALGIFAHHPEIDIAGLAVGERRRHAGHQPHRAQVDVLVELAPEFDQRAPQGNVIRDFRRPTDRAEIDRVMLADFRLPVFRHHAAVLFVIVTAGKIEIVQAQLETELFRRNLEHPHAFGHDFLADTIARNDGNAVDTIGLHASKSLSLDAGKVVTLLIPIRRDLQ